MVSRARRPGSRQKSREYTERALDDAQTLIPRIVYLPARLRGHNQHLDMGGLQVKITGPEIIDNHERIQEADPLGFMIAKMNGLPTPRFVIECAVIGCPDPLGCDDPKHGGAEPKVRIQYHTPTIKEQSDAARWLAGRITFRSPDAYQGPAHATSTQVLHAKEYDTLIQQAASRATTPDDDGEETPEDED